MKKLLSICLILTVGALSVIHAQITITVTTSPANIFFGSAKPLHGSDGSLLATGNRLVVGSFDFSGFESPSAFFGLNGGDLNFLASRFTKFGGDFDLRSTNAADVLVKDGGLFTSLVPGLVEGTALQNKQVFLWAFETVSATGKSDLGAAFDNVLAHGIYSGTTTGELWNFGDTNLPLGSFTIRTEEIGANVYVGGPDLSLIALGDITPIPEPSMLAVLLGAFAALGIVRRRR